MGNFIHLSTADTLAEKPELGPLRDEVWFWVLNGKEGAAFFTLQEALSHMKEEMKKGKQLSELRLFKAYEFNVPEAQTKNEEPRAVFSTL